MFPDYTSFSRDISGHRPQFWNLFEPLCSWYWGGVWPIAKKTSNISRGFKLSKLFKIRFLPLPALCTSKVLQICVILAQVQIYNILHWPADGCRYLRHLSRNYCLSTFRTGDLCNGIYLGCRCQALFPSITPKRRYKRDRSSGDQQQFLKTTPYRGYARWKLMPLCSLFLGILNQCTVSIVWEVACLLIDGTGIIQQNVLQ